MSSIPNRKPDEIYPMQFTDIVNNNHKFYLVLRWKGDDVAVRTYGRTVEDIGTLIEKAQKGQRGNGVATNAFFIEDCSNWTRYYSKHIGDRTSRSGKTAKKYGAPYSLIPMATEDDIKNVARALPAGKSANKALPSSTTKALATQTKTLHPAVRNFMQSIGVAADQSIRSAFSRNVMAMKPSHLQAARNALADFAAFNGGNVWNGYKNASPSDRKGAVAALNAYYRMIPPATLGRRLRDQEAQLVDNLMKQIETGVEEDKLDQLEQAIILEAQKVTGGTPASSDPVITAYDKLGCYIAPLDPNSDEYKVIYQRLFQAGPRGNKLKAKVRQMFALTIPSERKEFLEEKFGAHRVYPLFHGTAYANTRHILKQGLVIKRHAANGSRFGRGNYHSSVSDRSWQYCGSDRAGNYIMFVSHVKVGDPYKDDGANSRMDLTFIKKHGKHSVLGEGEWGGRGDEWITYLQSQSTLAYAIVLNR